MKLYTHHVQKLFFSPLLVLPSTYQTFERALLQRMGLPFDAEFRDPHAFRRGARMHDDNPDLVGEDDAKPPRVETASERAQRRINGVMKTYGSVAVISVEGAIDKRMSDYELDCYGGTDLADLDAAIMQVGNTRSIDHVVFDFHSPGGSAAGVPETAARIKWLGDFKSNGGAGKQTTARVELLCASAAQWLAAQCDKTVAAPSATVGSIGVYSALLDQTGWLEKNGLKVNLIKAGKFKAMGSSMKPLEDDERAMLQEHVDALWAQFKTAVRDGRKMDISEADMQGQCFTAAQGKKSGLVDSISPDSLDEFVGKLLVG
jgi:protease-4